MFRPLSAVLLLLTAVSVLATEVPAVHRWDVATSFRDIREVRQIGSLLYAATSGGLLVVEAAGSPATEYTTREGLGTNDLYDVVEDAAGTVWLAGNGRIIRFSEGISRPFLFFDGDDNFVTTYSISDFGDELWVGTGIGLVLFSKTIDGGQIEDSYQLFGDLNPAPAVYDVLMHDDLLWLATSDGLAVADPSDQVQLKSPAAWRTFSFDDWPQIGTDTLRWIVAHRDTIYIASARALLRFETGPLPTDTDLVPVALPSSAELSDVRSLRDSLFICYSDSAGGGLAVVVADASVKITPTGLPAAPSRFALFGNQRWLAVGSRGLYYQEGTATTEYPYTGLPSNTIRDLLADADGAITAGFGRVSWAREQGGGWQSLAFNVRDGATNGAVDSLGRAWMGTEGNGLWLFDGSALTWYNQTNSTLRGNSDGPSGAGYIRIEGVDTDGEYLYAICYRALNGYPLAVARIADADSPTGWDSIGIAQGLTDIFVISMDYHDGKVAVATETEGVFECTVGTNPFGTVQCRHLTRQNSLLISDDTKVVKYAPDGALWVGTPVGLSRYIVGIDRFVDIVLPPTISSIVTDIDFDSRGNVWLGTDSGLAFFDITSREFTVFQALNSPLVDDRINSITVDPFTGRIFVGTDFGYTTIPSPYGAPESDLSRVVAFPNPFIIESSGDLLQFNYAGTGEIYLYTVAGEQVRRLSINEAWDGTNASGAPVASGVYVALLRADDGTTATAKVLLIRR